MDAKKDNSGWVAIMIAVLLLAFLVIRLGDENHYLKNLNTVLNDSNNQYKALSTTNFELTKSYHECVAQLDKLGIKYNKSKQDLNECLTLKQKILSNANRMLNYPCGNDSITAYCAIDSGGSISCYCKNIPVPYKGASEPNEYGDCSETRNLTCYNTTKFCLNNSRANFCGTVAVPVDCIYNCSKSEKVIRTGPPTPLMNSSRPKRVDSGSTPWGRAYYENDTELRKL
jgi:hypothetical protein